MNTEASLKRLIKTIGLMNAELKNDELIETEIESFNELVDEMKTLTADYIVDLGPEELVKRLGANHWMLTNDDIDNDTDELLQGLRDLTK